MIPVLYDSKAENIICELKDTIKCVVHEIQNSVFELDLEYNIYSNNFNEIELNRIIKAKASDELGEQLFRIYYISNNINGSIEVKAQHISYDLIDNFIENVTCTNSTCEASFNVMLNKCQTPHKFKGYSDISHTSTYNLSRVNALEAILGTRGSLLDTYGNGAKFKRDNYNLYLNKSRGSNNGVKIAYAKNITGYKRELDESELVTCIYPFAKINNEVEEGESIEETLVLPERFIQSSNIDKYPHPKILAVDFSSDSINTISDLRRVSEKYFTNTKKDIPKINYEVEFIYLYQTSQYNELNLKELELVGMGDTVTIEDKRIGMEVEAQVIEYYYNSLTERYEKIILGNFKSSLNDFIPDMSDIESGLENVKNNMYANFEVLEDKIISEVSKLEGDVKTNTSLIQQTANSISSKVSNKDFESFKEQTANSINSKVSSGDVGSIISQSSENIQIGFNKINNRININSRSMDFTAQNGNKDMLLYNGQVCVYNNMDDTFLSTVGAVLNNKNNFKGVGFLAGANCSNFVVGRDANWSDILTNREPTINYYLNIDFDNYKITTNSSLKCGSVDMSGSDLNNVYSGKIKDVYCYNIRDYNNGNYLFTSNGNDIKVGCDLIFNGNAIMNPTLYTNSFNYTNGFNAFSKSVYGNNMMNNTNWDWQGNNLVRAKIYDSYAGYSLIEECFKSNKDIENDINIKIACEDISSVDSDGDVSYKLDDMFKLLYSKIDKLEKEIEVLKKEGA